MRTKKPQNNTQIHNKTFFCEKHMPNMLLSNENYKTKNYEEALKEVFVEIDYLLLSDEG